MFQITSLAYKIYDDSLQTEYSKEKLYYESVSWGGGITYIIFLSFNTCLNMIEMMVDIRLIYRGVKGMINKIKSWEQEYREILTNGEKTTQEIAKMSEEERKDYEKVVSLSWKKMDVLAKNPELYKKEWVDIIQNRREDILSVILDMPILYRGLSDEPQMFIINAVMYINSIKENRENVKKILQKIYKNQWEKEDDAIDIFSDDFKEICCTPILLPFIWYRPVSGVYLLHLLHPNKINFYHIPVTFSERDTAAERQQSKYNNSYMRHYKVYMDAFGRYLSLSLDSLFDKNEYGMKERQGTIGEKIFKELDYASYEINSYLSKKEGGNGQEASSYQNLLAMFEDKKKNAISYVEASMGAMMRGKLDFHPRYKGRLLFKTLLLQHIAPKDLLRIQEIFASLDMTLMQLVRFEQGLELYWGTATILKRSCDSQSEREKYDEMLSAYNEWLGNVPSKCEDMLNHKDMTADKEKLQVSEQNLYEAILWKMYQQEQKAIFLTIEQAAYVPSATPHEKIDEFQQYITLLPNEQIGVRSWLAFKEKYKYRMKDFFPHSTETEQMDLWMTSILLLVCLFPKHIGISMEKSDLPNTMSQKWLDDNDVDISHIRAHELFSIMFLVQNSADWGVERKGKNTKFYFAPLNKEKPKDVKGSLQYILQHISTHFASAQAPNNNEVLMAQIMIWMMEQHQGFFMTTETTSLFRKVQSSLLETYRKAVLYSETMESACKNAEQISDCLGALHTELFKKITALKNDNPQAEVVMAVLFESSRFVY